MNNLEPKVIETTIESESIVPEEDTALEELQDDSMGDFYELRNNIFIGTITIAVFSIGFTWFFYGQQTVLNYILGACFSLVYVNMLAREVEKVGRSKSGVGSTRLAIFVGLIIIATQRQQLQVIPIFLGFMTYKAAILFYILPLSLWGNLNKSRSEN